MLAARRSYCTYYRREDNKDVGNWHIECAQFSAAATAAPLDEIHISHITNALLIERSEYPHSTSLHAIHVLRQQMSTALHERK
ncbi:MAG: hypothetical protein ACXV2A_05840, partial [Halobacteriota archaeon]